MTTRGTTDFRIESHEREGGLQSIDPGMSDVAENLREVLRDMEALLRVADGEGSAADFERLDIEPDADPMDVAGFYIEDSWALDIKASEGRVCVLLAPGGPHIELDILRGPDGVVEEVILRRSWSSAHDRAWTRDDRALGIVADVLDLIGH